MIFRSAGCDYASVERANKQQLNPLLSQIVKTPFFRYFKVNLWCDCSFWPDDSMCVLRDCAVCECEDSEVPQVWKAEEGKCIGTHMLFSLKLGALAGHAIIADSLAKLTINNCCIRLISHMPHSISSSLIGPRAVCLYL